MDAEEDIHHPPRSNTHVARGKVNGEHSAALADKVIIKKNTDLISSFDREGKFQWYSGAILPTPDNTPLTF